MNRGAVHFLCLAIACVCTHLHADGDVIDRVYDPYVHPFEHELEYGALYQRDADDDRTGLQWQRFSYGQAFNERWAGEAYAINRPGGGGVDAIEFEAKRQLTEQGEHAIDWGMLLELERCFACNSWEGSAVLLAEHDWSRWVAVANLGLVYEWGGGIRSEFESRLAAQLRYRWAPWIEPGIELYAGEETRAVGPALTGMVHLGKGRGLRWNTAVVWGLDGVTPDTTAKFNVEFEF
jgi:hypothetical protein